jgi:DNA-binding transcriptional regulator YiaG
MGDVKHLRERFGLTREQFCDAFCIPYRTLQSWELGLRCCPLYVFRMMEMLLELSERTGGLEAFKKGVDSSVSE